MLFAQQPVDAHAIIADKGIAIGAAGGHEGDAAAEAIADDADLGRAFQHGACGANGRLDIADALILVEAGDIGECLLHLFGDVSVQLDMRIDAPEQVGRDRQITGAGPAVAFAADAFIDAENLLDDDDRRLGGAVGRGDIGVELAVAFQRLDRNIVCHGISFRLGSLLGRGAYWRLGRGVQARCRAQKICHRRPVCGMRWSDRRMTATGKGSR